MPTLIWSCSELLSAPLYMYHFPLVQVRIQDFHLGGGGGGGAQKIMCQHAHYERGTKLTFGRGPGPIYKGPGSSRVVLMLSHAFWALFLSILIKIGGKSTHSWSIFFFFFFLGGGMRLLDPPLLVWVMYLPCAHRSEVRLLHYSGTSL